MDPLALGHPQYFHDRVQAAPLPLARSVPLCSDFPHYRHLASAARSHLPVSVRAAGEMLCLPLHGGVSAATVADIAFIIGETLAHSPAQP